MFSMSGAAASLGAFRPPSAAPASRSASTSCAPRTVVSMRAQHTEKNVGMYGQKVGMTQLFLEDGTCTGVSVVYFGDNVVSKIQTPEKEGYTAVQVAYDSIASRKVTKPMLGHLEKAGVGPMRHTAEFRVKEVPLGPAKAAAAGAGGGEGEEGEEAKPAEAKPLAPGDALQLGDLFSKGMLLDVSGTTIGKGFAGTVKRYNFRRGLMTHGSKTHRIPGSIGCSATPSRVLPGKKMAGQMGNVTRKQHKVEVVDVDTELNVLVLKGSVPGKKGNWLRCVDSGYVKVAKKEQEVSKNAQKRSAKTK